MTMRRTDRPGVMPRWRAPRLAPGLALAVLASLGLGACSVPDAVNPVAWYRDATGASKNDPGEDAPNSKNLEAGGSQPYPNLASVPPPPTAALSIQEREALTQKLSADRANAKYIDEQLRIGPSASAAPPPAAAAPAASAPPAAAPKPQAVAAAPAPSVAAAPAAAPAPPPPSADDTASVRPQESPLTSPEITNLPEAETPRPAPPPAPSDLVRAPTPPAPAPPAPPAPVAAAAPAPPPPAAPAAPATPTPPAAAAAAPPSAQVAARPPAEAPLEVAPGAPVAQITFADNSTQLSSADRRVVDGVVPLQRRNGGGLRVVGHAAKPRGEGATQQLASFKMALARANAVATALTQAGIAPDQIAIEAAPPSSDGGGAASRAEIFLEN